MLLNTMFVCSDSIMLTYIRFGPIRYRNVTLIIGNKNHLPLCVLLCLPLRGILFLVLDLVDFCTGGRTWATAIGFFVVGLKRPLRGVSVTKGGLKGLAGSNLGWGVVVVLGVVVCCCCCWRDCCCKRLCCSSSFLSCCCFEEIDIYNSRSR